MDARDKKEIVERILSRAETGLYFLTDFLSNRNAKDGAYFRSILIILSYSFELVLKARVVSITKSINKTELEKELRDLNHDIMKISEKLGDKELNNIGIKSVSTRANNNFLGYIIRTNDEKEFFIENFIDVRYDFLKDSLRNLEEDEKVKEGIRVILDIVQRTRELSAQTASIFTEKICQNSLTG